MENRQAKLMNKKDKDYEVTTGNIFEDLGLDHPGELLARAKLLRQVSALIKNSKLSQQEVAKKLGITQPQKRSSIACCIRNARFQ